MYEIFEELMRQRGLTPYAVSKGSGVTQGALSRWKNGKSELSFESYKKLAAYFDVPVEYLVTGEMPHHYEDKDAREMADFLLHNPDYKVLFDASRRVKREDLEVVKAILDRFGGDDDVD